MAHANVWNSHPKSFGKGSRQWYVADNSRSFFIFLFLVDFHLVKILSEEPNVGIGCIPGACREHYVDKICTQGQQ